MLDNEPTDIFEQKYVFVKFQGNVQASTPRQRTRDSHPLPAQPIERGGGEGADPRHGPGGG